MATARPSKRVRRDVACEIREEATPLVRIARPLELARRGTWDWAQYAAEMQRHMADVPLPKGVLEHVRSSMSVRNMSTVTPMWRGSGSVFFKIYEAYMSLRVARFPGCTSITDTKLLLHSESCELRHAGHAMYRNSGVDVDNADDVRGSPPARSVAMWLLLPRINGMSRSTLWQTLDAFAHMASYACGDKRPLASVARMTVVTNQDALDVKQRLGVKSDAPSLVLRFAKPHKSPIAPVNAAAEEVADCKQVELDKMVLLSDTVHGATGACIAASSGVRDEAPRDKILSKFISCVCSAAVEHNRPALLDVLRIDTSPPEDVLRTSIRATTETFMSIFRVAPKVLDREAVRRLVGTNPPPLASRSPPRSTARSTAADDDGDDDDDNGFDFEELEAEARSQADAAVASHGGKRPAPVQTPATGAWMASLPTFCNVWLRVTPLDELQRDADEQAAGLNEMPVDPSDLVSCARDDTALRHFAMRCCHSDSSPAVLLCDRDYAREVQLALYGAADEEHADTYPSPWRIDESHLDLLHRARAVIVALVVTPLSLGPYLSRFAASGGTCGTRCSLESPCTTRVALIAPTAESLRRWCFQPCSMVSCVPFNQDVEAAAKEQLELLVRTTETLGSPEVCAVRAALERLGRSPHVWQCIPTTEGVSGVRRELVSNGTLLMANANDASDQQRCMDLRANEGLFDHPELSEQFIDEAQLVQGGSNLDDGYPFDIDAHGGRGGMASRAPPPLSARSRDSKDSLIAPEPSLRQFAQRLLALGSGAACQWSSDGGDMLMHLKPLVMYMIDLYGPSARLVNVVDIVHQRLRELDSAKKSLIASEVRSAMQETLDLYTDAQRRFVALGRSPSAITLTRSPSSSNGLSAAGASKESEPLSARALFSRCGGTPGDKLVALVMTEFDRARRWPDSAREHASREAWTHSPWLRLFDEDDASKLVDLCQPRARIGSETASHSPVHSQADEVYESLDVVGLCTNAFELHALASSIHDTPIVSVSHSQRLLRMRAALCRLLSLDCDEAWLVCSDPMHGNAFEPSAVLRVRANTIRTYTLAELTASVASDARDATDAGNRVPFRVAWLSNGRVRVTTPEW